MKHARLTIVFAVSLLVACSTSQIEEVVPPDLLGTEQPTTVPTATDEPTQTPPPATATLEPTDEPIVASNCVTCHTDQEALEVLAVEEEAAGEALSTGEG